MHRSEYTGNIAAISLYLEKLPELPRCMSLQPPTCWQRSRKRRQRSDCRTANPQPSVKPGTTAPEKAEGQRETVGRPANSQARHTGAAKRLSI